MKLLNLFMILLMTTAVILSVGCTSSSDSGSTPQGTPEPTVAYQDQEFITLFTESQTEITELLDNLETSAQNNDVYGLVIDGAALKASSYVYAEELKTLTVSPAFEPAKTDYLKALEELSDAGVNYGTAGEYMENSDYTTATEYLTKGAANVNSATELTEKVRESIV